MSKVGLKTNLGLFILSDLMKKTPDEFQTRLARRMSCLVAKISKIDAGQCYRDGSEGKR